MEHYIDKDALVAEIERWIELLTNQKNQEGVSQIDKLSLGGRIAELQEVKSFLDTIEVKEVQEEPVSEDICNQCEAHNDKDKCDELVFGHNCPIVTTSEDFEKDVKLIINKL